MEYDNMSITREATDVAIFGAELKEDACVTMTMDDIGRLIIYHNKENANVPHGPEATNMTIAEKIKKEYALSRVYSPEISRAHQCGDIHLHDLGMVDRPYCSGNSIEYIKKFGLNLPNAISIAKPAKHPEVLIEQIIKMSAALQGSFAGAIGWDAVNLFLAPYLKGVDDKQMHQLAQILVYEFAQQAVARGGQSIFSDLNLYWEIPCHFKEVPAIGPGGKFTGDTYGAYEKESRAFVDALFDVYLEGDAMGRPFFFPKPNVHITDEFFKTDGHEEFLEKLCTVASEKGSPYFVFDRGNTAKISECCRLTFKLEMSDLKDAQTPWKMRYSAMQNVTLNMPRIAYEAKGDEKRLFELISERLDQVAQAHLMKKNFITGLLGMGMAGPLSLLAMELDGEPYYRLKKATFLVGLLGLNEMVQYHCGEQLHESKAAYMLGMKILAYMGKESERIGNEYGITMKLEQTPAESTSYRMAMLDAKMYPEAMKVLKGTKDSWYYTNSTQMNTGAAVGVLERVKGEGRMHPLIEAGCMTHVWLGDHKPCPESLAAFVKKTFETTQSAQIAFSPEFTGCLTCGKTTRGLHDDCSLCGSVRVEHMTRVTGYFSKIESWNKGKIAELRDRRKYAI